MEKIDRFRFLLYQLLKDCILPADKKRIEVNILGYKGSSSMQYNVNIGIQDIKSIYKHNDDFSALLGGCGSLEIECEDEYELCGTDIYNKLGINVDSFIHPAPPELLDNSSFLGCSILNGADVSTTFSIMFVIFHEIGHVINNEHYNCELDKEYAADEYAFQSLKSYIPVFRTDFQIPIIVGGVCAILNILYNRTIQEENDDTDHPYSIERIYLLLESFNLDDSSKIWEKAYMKIADWLRINEMIEQINTDQSLSFKAKVEELYNIYKRRIINED